MWAWLNLQGQTSPEKVLRWASSQHVLDKGARACVHGNTERVTGAQTVESAPSEPYELWSTTTFDREDG